MRFKDTNSSGSTDYLKLKPGEPVRGIFMGDPSEYRIHWLAGKSVTCNAPNSCPQCDLGNKSSFRFQINVIVKENEIYTTKIWEQGITVYEALKALHADYNLEKHVMKITRNGTTKDDTTYSVIPLPQGSINTEMASKLKEVKLHSLGSQTSSFNDKPDIENWTPPTDSDFVPEKMEDSPF